MKYLTNTFPEALNFFKSVIGIHDSTIENVCVLQELKSCILTLSEVYEHSPDYGFRVAYMQLFIEMRDVKIEKDKDVTEFTGYDVADAELLPGTLWIKTLAGSIVFRFEKISFAISE